MWTRLVPSSKTNDTYRRLSVTVSTWKKSVAKIVPAWARRNARQVGPSSRIGAGGTRWLRSVLRMVAAATRWPIRRSSPWMRVYPQDGFSLAIRRISSTNSCGIGGRPGGRGWRHLAAASRRCQPNTVLGVTSRCVRSSLGISPISAANSARSAQSSRGLGFARRNTATSWRSTRSSTSLTALPRPTNTSHEAIRQNRRYIRRGGTGIDHSAPNATRRIRPRQTAQRVLEPLRQAPCFTDRERAAFALTDAMTLLSESHVPDNVYALAAAHFDQPELAQLISLILTINSWNRIGVATRLQPANA